MLRLSSTLLLSNEKGFPFLEEMLQKNISVITIYDFQRVNQPLESITRYVVEQLSALKYYNIKQTIAIPCSNKILLVEEVEKSLKHCDIVLLLAGQYSALAYQLIAKVFHQTLPSIGLTIPKYARILGYCQSCPILYIQGLIVLPNDDACRAYTYVDKFLQNYAKSIQYGKSLVLHNTKDAQKLPLKENITVSRGKGEVEGFVKVIITSSSLSCLLNYMDSLRGLDIEIVKCEGGLDVAESLYTLYNYNHIKHSIQCIEKCFNKYSPENVFICFNGGKDCTVLLHITLGVLKRNFPHFDSKNLLCLYIEHANPFPEVQNFILQCKRYYGFNLMKISKTIKESLEIILKNHTHMRACLMGTRSTDPFSENLDSFQMTDSGWPQVMRVSPLLDWHYSQIWDYLLNLKVPYCCLYDMGYTSLGNITNTIPNPELRDKDGSYLPAYKLFDASRERHGRSEI